MHQQTFCQAHEYTSDTSIQRHMLLPRWPSQDPDLPLCRIQKRGKPPAKTDTTNEVETVSASARIDAGFLRSKAFADSDEQGRCFINVSLRPALMIASAAWVMLSNLPQR